MCHVSPLPPLPLRAVICLHVPCAVCGPCMIASDIVGCISNIVFRSSFFVNRLKPILTLFQVVWPQNRALRFFKLLQQVSHTTSKFFDPNCVAVGRQAAAIKSSCTVCKSDTAPLRTTWNLDSLYIPRTRYTFYKSSFCGLIRTVLAAYLVVLSTGYFC